MATLVTCDVCDSDYSVERLVFPFGVMRERKEIDLCMQHREAVEEKTVEAIREVRFGKSQAMPLSFKRDAEPVVSSDFWYDLTDGGYIKPENFLDTEGAKRVSKAVNLLKKFMDGMIVNDLLEKN